MSEPQTKQSMAAPAERLLLFVPLLAAAAFSCSATYYLGTFIGIGRADMLRLLTFSDVVNGAVPLGLLMLPGVALGVMVIGQVDRPVRKVAQKIGHPAAAKTLHIGAIFIFTIVSSLVLLSLGWISWWIAIALSGFPGSLMVINKVWFRLSERVPKEICILGAFTTLALWGAFTAGAMGSYTTSNSGMLQVVETSSAHYATRYSVELERGVLMLEPFGFQLIPWAEVKSMMAITDFSQLDADPVVDPGGTKKNSE